MSFLLRAFSITSLSLCVALKDPVRITEPYQIVPHSSQRSLFQDYGVVSGARSCGESGKLISWRYEGCSSGFPSPCVLSTDSKGRAEVVFVPEEASGPSGVGVRTTITTLEDEKVHQWETYLPGTILKAHREYVFNTAGQPTSELSGKDFTVSLEVFRKSDAEPLFCAEADMYVVE